MSESGMPIILVTGGTGFAGSHLLELLTSQQPEAELHATSFRGGNDGILPSSVNIHPLDMSDAEAINSLIKELQPTQIYHLASFAVVHGSHNSPVSVLQNNITLQANLLEAIKNHSPKSRLMVTGSGEEYGQVSHEQVPVNEDVLLTPVNPYAVSKVAQDLLAQAYYLSYGLDIVRVRPFNHTGERQTADFVVPSFAKQIVCIERGDQTEILVGNLDAIRDFTDVKDMVKAYTVVMEKGTSGSVYNIGSGKEVKIQDMLDQLCALASTPIKIIVDPARIRPLDVPRMIADNGKIKELGWEPTIPLTDTLQRVLAYWRSQS
jgi:GDP-4-dehydro-6-deoxy-D-mannose reductase